MHRTSPVDLNDVMKRFAKALVSLLDEYTSVSTKMFEDYLKVKTDKMRGIEYDYKPYERMQAIYSWNKFIEVQCKVIKMVNIDDSEGLISPSYEEIRVGKSEYKRLLTIGDFFIEWKKTRMILRMDFDGEWRMKATLLYRMDRDEKKIEEFLFEFRKFMRNNNLLKGEKIVFLPHRKFDFLEYPELDWSDVVLKDSIKEEIMLNIIFPLSREKECLKCGIPWRRGLLLGGVVGTGKTQVCRVLCNKVPDNVTIIWATPKALYDVECVEVLFEAARYLYPTIVVIEDIDFIGTERTIDMNDDILGELLTQLDGNDPNYGVFVIATTNRLNMLDMALADRPSRFDVKIEFKLPENDERIKLIELFTKNMKFEEPLNLTQLSPTMSGLTGAHIKEVFIYAQLKALSDNKEKVRLEDVMNRIAFFKKREGPKMVT